MGICHKSFAVLQILATSCTSPLYEFSWIRVVSVLDRCSYGSALRDDASHSNFCLKPHISFRSWVVLCIDFETNPKDVLAWFGVCKDHSSSVRSLEIYKCFKRLIIFNNKMLMIICQTAYLIFSMIILPGL